MTNAVGTKNKIAARIQRLMDDVPLCPAAAIQRGPRTVTILNRRMSQKPRTFRSWCLGSCGEAELIGARSHSDIQSGNQFVLEAEIAKIGVLRFFKFRPTAEKRDTTFLKKNDTVGENAREVGVVGHDNGCLVEFFLQLEDQARRVRGHDGIHHGGW